MAEDKAPKDGEGNNGEETNGMPGLDTLPPEVQKKIKDLQKKLEKFQLRILEQL